LSLPVPRHDQRSTDNSNNTQRAVIDLNHAIAIALIVEM
jgi:hypothetical protein